MSNPDNTPPRVSRIFSGTLDGSPRKSKKKPASLLAPNKPAATKAPDRRQAFTKAAAMPCSRSSNAIPSSRRRDRTGSTMDTFFRDLKIVKAEVDSALKRLVKETETGTESKSELLVKMMQLASHFASLKASNICGGASRKAIETINQLHLRELTAKEKAFAAQLLFQISKCARFEEYKDDQEAKTQKSSTKGTPEESRRSNLRQTKSTTSEASGLRASRYNLPVTQPEELVAGESPSTGVKSTPALLVPGIDSPRVSPRGGLRSIVTQAITCRICDRMVPGHLFKSHSKLCSIKVQWEIRSLECDNFLRRIHDRSLVRQPVTLSVQQIQDISKRAAEKVTSNPYATFDAMLQMVELILKTATQGSERVTLILAKDLKDWLTYKREAWSNIIRATNMMETFMGNHATEDETHSLTTRIPSIQDFEIIKPFTKGGFARVYLAKRRTCDDYFAIKVLDKCDITEKTQIENVLSERNILANTCCPYVVRLYYAFQTKDNLFLAMEFLSGGDFFTLLNGLNCFEEDFTRFYIAELVLALEYLHESGIIHRDLKPDNMLINSKGHMKLTDFGLSRTGLSNHMKDILESEGNKDELAQQDGQVVGTPDYLAPEVLLGLGHSFPVDWWALGILLYEFLTGIPPFTGETVSDIFQNIVCGEIVWPDVPEEMSEEAQDLISRLLHPDPALRLGANGSEEVKKHPFFNSISWESLLKDNPPFRPSAGEEDTSYFEAREEYWPLIEEDFGEVFAESKDSRNSDPKFEDFWCINVKNLQDRNLEVLGELQALVKLGKSPSRRHRKSVGRKDSPR